MKIHAALVRETSKAVLIKTFKDGKEVWLPKSQSKQKGWNSFIIPDWLGHKLGLSSTIRMYDSHDDVLNEIHLPNEVKINVNGFLHQIAALNKLYNKSSFALFMQCRTGKTKVAIDILYNHFLNGVITNVVWICPISVIDTAKKQWKLFCPMTMNIVFIGIETISQARMTRVNTELSNINELSAVIIDESHMIKNVSTRRSNRIFEFIGKAKVKGILSGTPITRNIDDLFNQFKFLNPKILGYKNKNQFDKTHLIMSDKIPGLIYSTQNVDYLKERIEPITFEYFIKFNAENNNIYIPLSEDQYNLYQLVKKTFLYKLKSFTDKKEDVYLFFTALQNILSGFMPRNMADKFGLPAKNDIIINSYKVDYINWTNKTLIWCSRRNDLTVIKDKFPGCAILNGDIPVSRRNEIITDFKLNGGLLVAMTHVARHGIDISECNDVIFYSNSFNYEHREQAQSRVFHINKSLCSKFTNLIYKNSIDERIFTSINKKENLISDFFKLSTDGKIKMVQNL